MAEIIPVIPKTDAHRALVQAAGDAIEEYLTKSGYPGVSFLRPYAVAREALNATLPLIEAAVRERVAKDIEALAEGAEHWIGDEEHAYTEAAAIARAETTEARAVDHGE